MTTPAGDQSAPSIQATWQVTRVGHQASLSVNGVALLPTTVVAVWTSSPHDIRPNESSGAFDSYWEAPEPPVGAQSSQAFAMRYTKPRGGWAAWLDMTPKDYPYAMLGYGGKVTRDIVYSGPRLVRGQIQYRLVLHLEPGTEVQQTWNVYA